MRQDMARPPAGLVVAGEEAAPAFPQGAGIDATNPELPVRVRSPQVVRMLERPAGETSLAPEVQRIVADGCTPCFALAVSRRAV